MNAILIAEACGTDISSRSRAASLREDVIARVAQLGAVSLDFTGVRTISDSFADELFGVLVHDRGESWFQEHVKVSGLTSIARETVLDAISQRLKAA